MACKRFLLLIDFLGFSDFVLKEPLKHVLAWYEETTKESMSWLDKRNVKQSDIGLIIMIDKRKQFCSSFIM